MCPIEEQLSRLADHAMAAHAERARSQGEAPVRRPISGSWKFAFATVAVAAAAMVGVVVVTGDDEDSGRVVPATVATDDTVPDSTVTTVSASTTPATLPAVTGGPSVESTVPTDSAPTTTVMTTTTTAPPVVAQLTVRQGGVGDFDFGTPMDVVVAAVSAELGTATTSDSPTGFPVFGCEPHFVVTWSSANLELAFVGDDSDGCQETVVLVGWTLYDPTGRAIEVRLDTGVGVGAPFSAAKTAIPGLELYPAGSDFYAGVPSWAAVGEGDRRMGLYFGGWDYVTAVQRGLIANGADIVADGRLGQRTSEAYQAFVAAHSGLGNEAIFGLLGALPPDESGVTIIRAGLHYWWEPDECGEDPYWTLEGETCRL
ncbi:MAG: hypothetical protein Q7V88_09705 [Actinomycetota bacterium]|nr:hypothetical protein [Actinomycetota bacterium]